MKGAQDERNDWYSGCGLWESYIPIQCEWGWPTVMVHAHDSGASGKYRKRSKVTMCYVLNLPLLFLTLLHLLIHLHTRLPIPGTALLLSPTFLTPFPLILLISSPALPLNPLLLPPCYAISPIPLIALLSSIPYIQTEIPQSSGLRPRSMRLMLIP